MLLDMNFLERSLDNKNQVWRYVVVILGFLFASGFIGAIPILCVVISQVAAGNADISSISSNPSDLTALGISQNLSLFLMLFSTVVGLIASIFLIKWTHNRSFSETINGTKKIRWNRFFVGVLIWGALLAVYLVISYLFDPNNFILQFNISTFIPLFFISVVMIPFQTTSEEYLFRGYFSQGIAAWTKNRWLAIIIPAILFGLMHSFNPEVDEYGFWVSMPQYIYFGLLFGFVSVIDDGIELAMGVHAINNVFLSLFITHKSSVLQTPAVFSQESINIGQETIVLIVSGLIAIFIFAKIYRWNFSILNKKVELIQNIES